MPFLRVEYGPVATAGFLGAPVLVVCPAAETKELCRRLNPRGLVAWPEGLTTAVEARELVVEVLAGR